MILLLYLQIPSFLNDNLLSNLFWNEVLRCLQWLKLYLYVSKCVCCTLFNFSTDLKFFKMSSFSAIGFPIPFYIALVFLIQLV